MGRCDAARAFAPDVLWELVARARGILRVNTRHPHPNAWNLIRLVWRLRQPPHPAGTDLIVARLMHSTLLALIDEPLRLHIYLAQPQLYALANCVRSSRESPTPFHVGCSQF
ncbi:MAG: hypothetical protein JNM85_02925 [Chthonomonas sp.]|nr:hypothetical protein [Chthonomonas sp.]